MWRWTGVLVSVLALEVAAGAGEIELKNGSRLQAELANEVLLISTGTDLVEVDPVQVSVLTGEEVRLVDGRVVRGTLVGGRVKVRTSLGELAVEVDRLRAFRREREASEPAGAAPSGESLPGSRPAPSTPPIAATPPAAASSPPAPAAAPPAAPASPPKPVPSPTVPPTSASAMASPPQAAPAQPGGAEAEPGRETRSGTRTTIPDAATGVGRAVVEAADLLHDGFKAFGLSVWEAMKGVGRAVQSVF